ncbi:MAG: hypothetical protein ACD_17C00038G0001 [uncultured bacterium]|nr:MAG: hypothetical protein ACD_17C00038G0001 [uncultured bacterium]OGN56907.1 MAG: hypothetical protein A2796_06775 [Chlamydiae bacterium RIFCSPHIGHO2_01_FULL_44_39]OGN59566.1 MAG: hypothetical protein A3D96_07465 [Chlamydiae bacterium RIFCSPHIGHO2_12_FULL_44_59]OGN67312.1 MAG: hypothetical protein A2978_03295 [Chlamydiae bacterium RIFCSPLOWO2_01_FULL_44_52]OGN68738.1 MAG: hypothetical protein A3I67_03025 [Chlamydiae bacterium RIFCSPLOWO2_02_FULL_45_22]OGN69254.1 MAG: hypothetical protein A3
MEISVCILTKNAERTLASTLASVKTFSEIILLDNGSTDATLHISRQYPNTKIHTSPFIGFGPLRNYAASLATHDWILALDSDEILSQDLILELQAITLDPSYSYLFPRHNFLYGKRVRGCGWDSEYIARLYHRQYTHFCHSQVHESLVSKKYFKMKFPILHTPYHTTVDFLSKMQSYSSLFAEQHQGKKKSSFGIALAHGSFAFFRSLLLKKGIFCGTRGWLISFYNASTTFYKYLKLEEYNKKTNN